MISLEEAQERIFAAIQPLPAEEILLSNALGRYLAASIPSPVNLPPSDNSAMDGYAVRADDLNAATAETPVTLCLMGEARAGKPWPGEVTKSGCVRIFTGANLPRGADAVVMQEDVKRPEGRTGSALFVESIKPWENVRLSGEDVRTDALLVEAGAELTPQRLSLLAAAGIAKVQVGRQPRVALLSTGDELCEPGNTLQPGMIYESNRVGLAAMVRRAGGLPRIYPLVPDDLQLTSAALRTAFEECDLVVTSGGISVGETDWVKPAFTKIGGQLDFWRVSIKPGKPFALGTLGEKLLFGLPGNPVSALLSFSLLGRPALLRLQNAHELQPPISWGKLTEPLKNHGDRRFFIRVTMDAHGQVSSAGPQASHFLSSMAGATGLVEIPPGKTLDAGAMVPVLLWN